MQTMKLNSEAEERRRSFRMSKGLQSFQDGKDGMDFEDQNEKSSVDYDSFVKQGDGSFTMKTASDERLESSHSHDVTQQNTDTPNGAAGAHPNSVPDTLQSSKTSDSESESSQLRDQFSHPTFVRAANILRESLGLEYRGGVVFLNSGMGSRQAHNGTTLTDMAGSGEEFEDPPSKLKRQKTFHSSFTEQDLSKPSDVMSFSTAQIPLGMKRDLDKAKTITPLRENMLQHLLHRYPRGKIWTFDAAGNLAEGGRASPLGHQSAHNQRRQAEASLLIQHFPNGNFSPCPPSPGC